MEPLKLAVHQWEYGTEGFKVAPQMAPRYGKICEKLQSGFKETLNILGFGNNFGGISRTIRGYFSNNFKSGISHFFEQKFLFPTFWFFSILTKPKTCITHSSAILS